MLHASVYLISLCIGNEGSSATVTYMQDRTRWRSSIRRIWYGLSHPGGSWEAEEKKHDSGQGRVNKQGMWLGRQSEEQRQWGSFAAVELDGLERDRAELTSGCSGLCGLATSGTVGLFNPLEGAENLWVSGLCTQACLYSRAAVCFSAWNLVLH